LYLHRREIVVKPVVLIFLLICSGASAPAVAHTSAPMARDAIKTIKAIKTIHAVKIMEAPGAAAAREPAPSPSLSMENHPDSLLPISNLGLNTQDLVGLAELWDIEKTDDPSTDHKRTLSRLLKMLGPNAKAHTRKIRFHLFQDLAKVSTKLRLYPLAMRCYYNAWRKDVALPEDSSLYQELPSIASVPVQPDSIVASFKDGKEAAFYALLLEIKQPSPGKRTAYRHITEVGHTFITLLKYNKDGSIVSQTFGFYPHKTWILSGTPFNPTAPSVIKDDARHEWDEAAGKLISQHQFNSMLGVLQSYAHRHYNLNHRNCTDFGLAVAQAGGIKVWETKGGWPLGYGNNPGSAGQSMLEGKVADTSFNHTDSLMLIDNVKGLF
jgi:hypothetical protein